MPKLLTLLAFLSLYLCLGVKSHGQMDNNVRGKLYFMEAERRFTENDFKEALVYLDKTDETLGSTNGVVLNLRIKTLYNLGRFKEAESAFNLFVDRYSDTVSTDVRQDTLSYFVRLEKAAASERNELKKQDLNKRLQGLKKQLRSALKDLDAIAKWSILSKGDRVEETAPSGNGIWSGGTTVSMRTMRLSQAIYVDESVEALIKSDNILIFRTGNINRSEFRAEKSFSGLDVGKRSLISLDKLRDYRSNPTHHTILVVSKTPGTTGAYLQATANVVFSQGLVLKNEQSAAAVKTCADKIGRLMRNYRQIQDQIKQL